MIKTKHISIVLLLCCLSFCWQCSKKKSIPASNDKEVGASANDILSAANYSSIVIEIQYMPGFQPDANTLSNLLSFLNSLNNKPGGITITQTQIPSAGKSVLSLDDITNIEKTNRTAYNSGSNFTFFR